MKNQSVGRKMSRNFYFYKVKSRHICEIFKTCFVNANDDFDDKPTYLYQVDIIYCFIHEKIFFGQIYPNMDTVTAV